MFQLVYVSTTSWAISHAEMNEVLDASRRNNRVNGVSGLLLHIDRGFLQILEGSKAAVAETYARIVCDKRHGGCRVLVEQEIGDRLFGTWSMGYEHLRPSASRTSDIFAAVSYALDGIMPPERAAHIAVLFRDFYRAEMGNRAA
ncbi:MAG: BLUF domain-containing protein [Alphaproteobacteria bacterium]|nr:BLUF domain-containing protein [Alphaproteobacteria bacterium]MDE2494566.1 BLUF domain-containing protein [Alphaproteobacteria bacterium]